MRAKIIAVSLLALAFPVAVRAQTPKRTQLTAYRVPIDYTGDTLKDAARATGLYVYRGEGADRSYELGAESSKFDYLNNFPYDQQDYTFVVSKYKPGSAVRLGAHVVRSNTKTNDAFTLVFGINDYATSKTNSQIDFYLSSYDRSAPKRMAYQASYKRGRNFGSGDGRNVYAATQINMIRLSKEIGLKEQNFLSAEQSISFQADSITLTGSGWIGRQALAVRNNGFVIYNKAEKYKGGYGASLTYSLQPEYSLTLGYAKETFVEADGLGGWRDDARAEKYTLSLNHTY